MTTPSPDKLRDLARALKTLVGMPTEARTQLEEWYAASQRLQKWIKNDPDFCNSVPHFVWHYLSDADIRRKDSIYEAEQKVQLMEIVDLLERGEIPPV